MAIRLTEELTPLLEAVVQEQVLVERAWVQAEAQVGQEPSVDREEADPGDPVPGEKRASVSE
jgi:hypothetical protein